MAKIALHIEADSLPDLMAAMSGMAAPPSGVAAETQRRTRGPAKERGEATGSAPPSGAADAPTPNGPDDPDLMASPPPTAPPPQARFPTPDAFIEAVKKLLGKGKDDAVRAKLKELGFERVRDVPADKYEATIDVLAKV